MYNATIEPKSIHLAQAEHTSEIGSSHLMKLPSELLQNLLYFQTTKTQVLFSFFKFVPHYCFSLYGSILLLFGETSEQCQKSYVT